MKTASYVFLLVIVLASLTACSQKTDDKVTPDTIYRDYRKFQDTPSGEKHAERYYALKETVRENQDALYELVFSGKVTDPKELRELIFFGGHGGSVGRE